MTVFVALRPSPGTTTGRVPILRMFVRGRRFTAEWCWRMTTDSVSATKCILWGSSTFCRNTTNAKNSKTGSRKSNTKRPKSVRLRPICTRSECAISSMTKWFDLRFEVIRSLVFDAAGTVSIVRSIWYLMEGVEPFLCRRLRCGDALSVLLCAVAHLSLWHIL